MPLAVDGQGRNGLPLEKLRLNFSSCLGRAAGIQKIGINGHGLFSLSKLRLYLPLDVQR